MQLKVDLKWKTNNRNAIMWYKVNYKDFLMSYTTMNSSIRQRNTLLSRQQYPSFGTGALSVAKNMANSNNNYNSSVSKEFRASNQLPKVNYHGISDSAQNRREDKMRAQEDGRMKQSDQNRLPAGLSSSYLRHMNQEKQTVYRPTKGELNEIISSKAVGLVGLHNIGNTCFMNATLQCMFNLPGFNEYFLQNKHSRESKGLGKVNSTYARLVQAVKVGSNRSETTSELKSAIGAKKPRFLGYMQQDAQQFLAALLQCLSSELNRSDKPRYKELQADTKKSSLVQISEEWWKYNREREDSIVCDFFAGQLLSRVVCSHCKTQSIAFDNTWDIALNFTQEDRGEVGRMIQNFLRPERISSDYYCGACKKERECTRKLDFFRLPRVLVLQLKRFSYGKYSKSKISTRVKVPLQLDLAPFITQNSHSSLSDPLYSLVGVVHHSGEINFGHYTADCRNASNQRWYRFNDDDVSETYVGDSIDGSTPYLLFYYKSL